MNVNKININQSESSYYIASDIYDVSARNNGATFESLQSLLSSDNLSTLIPTSFRCGGMTIRFVQSTDNKYVQYRLISTSFSTTESDWQDVAIIGTDRIADGAVTYEKLRSDIKKYFSNICFPDSLTIKVNKETYEFTYKYSYFICGNLTYNSNVNFTGTGIFDYGTDTKYFLFGLCYILFNKTTKEIAFVSFSVLNNYRTCDWLLVNVFYEGNKLAIFNNTKVIVDGNEYIPIQDRVVTANKLSLDLQNLINTFPNIGFSNLLITINRETWEFTYKKFQVFYGKNKYAYDVPSGSGTYAYVAQGILIGLNSIFFNISTKEVAWTSFEKYSDYTWDKNWIALEHFVGTTPVFGFIKVFLSSNTPLSRFEVLSAKVTKLEQLTSTGILWSNLFEGSDMENGYNQDNILAFSTYPPLGGTVERVIDNEVSRHCIKVHFPAGTTFTSFLHPSLIKAISFTGEDTTQEFSISFRYKCSHNLAGFCTLCNNTWMEYLSSDGNWRHFYASSISFTKDNNWHYAHVVTRGKSSNKTYLVGIYAFLHKMKKSLLHKIWIFV